MNKKAKRLPVMAVMMLVTSVALAAETDSKECSLATLDGSYVFAASGHTLVGGVWVPKAIIEYISFKGDGTLTVPAATVANRFGDGKVEVTAPPDGEGVYTLESGCTGTLTFSHGPVSTLSSPPKGMGSR
jgi:hypothetical protein